MPKLVPMDLDDKTRIYIEATEDVITPEINENLADEGLVAKDGMKTAIEKFKSIEGTIRAYTSHTLAAFKGLSNVNVDKVSLEFGIKIGGEVGIPYVTKGTAESNLKITVECSFPDRIE